jgi:uncharacterized protein YyaL (SSP411 family)
MLEEMVHNNRLLRAWREGTAKQTGFLEDYASFGLGLLELYQANPEPRWYQASLRMLEAIVAHFSDAEGGLFDTPDGGEALLYRPKDLQDNATPSGNALAATLMLKLTAYEGRSDWREMAEDLLTTNLNMLKRYPSAFGCWLSALDLAIGPLLEAAIVGELALPATQALLRPLYEGYYPRLVMAAADFPPDEGSPALLMERPLINGKPTAYICQDFVCRQPVNDPAAMIEQVEK